MNRPRVLLVEDDASLRRFVGMALEEQPLQLLQADTVAVALQLLAAEPVHLIITDLMMPGESGLDLLRHLQRQPLLRAGAHVVVMSAGLTAEMREQLRPFDVWRQLQKPVSLTDLRACVRDALAAVGMTMSTPAVPDASRLSTSQLEAVRLYFGSDNALFTTYLAACRAQFPHDVTAADAALIAGDAATLRRIAHSLKAVLQSIGCPGMSAQARDLEQACATTGLAPPAGDLWQALRSALLHEASV